MTIEALDRVEIPCRDLARQRDFYGRLLGLTAIEQGANRACYALGPLRLVLRPRGDALFPLGAAPGLMLALRVAPDELQRWHRRLMAQRVAVLAPPHATPDGRVALHAADPEGNVIELVAEEA